MNTADFSGKYSWDFDAEKWITQISKSKNIFFTLQRLKAAFHYTIGRLTEDKGAELEVKFGKTLIAAVTELTFNHLGSTVAKDLEAFSR